ncbi:hypothetical protein FQA39_LY04513 [Lamprigera yunnana]|nr:hypothetical protein FQA39_LY04513 [Lamprigera yunnana]
MTLITIVFMIKEENTRPWAGKIDDMPSGESDMSEAENDDTEDANFEKCSGSSSDDGDDNSEDDADDICNPILHSMSGYVSLSGMDLSVETSAKNKIEPHNTSRCATPKMLLNIIYLSNKVHGISAIYKT